MPIQPCRLDQAHDRRRSFTTAKRPGKQPIRAPESPWSDLIFDWIIFDWIIVDGHSSVINVARQRYPAFKAVSQGFGRF